MKKKLSQWQADAAAAKSAWLAARKDTAKKPDDVKALLDAYQIIQANVDAWEGEGKKADDECEVPAAKAAPEVVDLKEIESFISKAVEKAVKDQLPETMKGQVKLADIENVVKTQLASLNLPAKTGPNDEQVKSVVAATLDAQIKALNLPSKFKHSTDDKNPDGTPKITAAPCSLRKGNLPLHMKQLTNALMRKPMNEGIEADVLTKGADLGDQMFVGYFHGQGFKALTSDGTGLGAEWVPRDLTSELYRRLYLESTLAQLMAQGEIQMPSDPYDLPLLLTRPTFFANRIQNRDARASDAGTGKFTLTTTKLMALLQYSYEANEDSIIPLLPTLQRLLGESAAFHLEDAIINGDTTSTHQDNDTTDTDDHRKIWMGLRKLALAQAALKVDLSTGGISRANAIALKKRLKKWGRNIGQLAWIIGTQGENDFLGLDDVALWQNRGSAPTTATGTINSYLGIPIVVSEASREDLNASGVYDGSTTTKGSLLLARLDGFVMGSRREFTLEVDRNIRSQTNDIVASFRKAFQPVETPSATIRTVAVGYNYTS